LADRSGGPSDISRAHRIAMPKPGWLDVAGGKLTTYREMARQVVDRAAPLLRRHGGAVPAARRAPGLPFGGGTPVTELEAMVENERRQAPSAHEARIVGDLARLYGGGFKAILELAKAESRLAGEIPGLSGETSHWRVQVAFAVRHEAALSVADVLSRRLRIQLTDGFQGLGCVSHVAELMAREIGESLGWDREQARRWAEAQAEAYEAEVKRMRAFREKM